MIKRMAFWAATREREIMEARFSSSSGKAIKLSIKAGSQGGH
jgi:hypothetical protein